MVGLRRQLGDVDLTCDGEVALPQHVLDHSLETQLATVVRGVDSGDAVRVQFFDLFGQDHAAAAAEDLDVTAPAFFQQVEHVASTISNADRL